MRPAIASQGARSGTAQTRKEHAMSKAVSRGQALELASRFNVDVDWDALDGDAVQRRIISLPREELGRRFTAFLKNGANLIFGSQKIIPIDRSKPFNPAEFIGKSWDFWRGPIDGDGLSGDLDEDPRSTAIAQLDLSQIQLVTTLHGSETVVGGEEKQRRLKAAGYIRLDLGIFQTFWENRQLVPQLFRELTNGDTTYVFFDGQPLRSPHGFCFVLYLYFGVGRWHWDYHWLDSDFDAFSPSAVLASPAAQAA